MDYSKVTNPEQWSARTKKAIEDFIGSELGKGFMRDLQKKGFSEIGSQLTVQHIFLAGYYQGEINENPNIGAQTSPTGECQPSIQPTEWQENMSLGMKWAKSEW